MSLRSTLTQIAISVPITTAVVVGVHYAVFKLYGDRAFEAQIAPTCIPNDVRNLTKEQVESLESALERDSSSETPLDNVCSFVNLSTVSKGNCVFLSRDWVLLTYHQIEPHGPYGLRTSRGDFVNGTEMDIIAESPLEDLSLLKVEHDYSYLDSVSIPETEETTQEDLTLVHLRTYSFEGPDIETRDIPEATISSDAVYTFGGYGYRFARFDFEDEGPFRIAEGVSGGPIFKGSDLKGILSRGNTELGTASYSPRIRGFLEKSMEYCL
jgi:hypothetical protein